MCTNCGLKRAKNWATSLSRGNATRRTGYAVIDHGRRERLNWWTRAENGGWIAMAAFRQTHADGSQGLPVC